MFFIVQPHAQRWENCQPPLKSDWPPQVPPPKIPRLIALLESGPSGKLLHAHKTRPSQFHMQRLRYLSPRKEISGKIRSALSYICGELVLWGTGSSTSRSAHVNSSRRGFASDLNQRSNQRYPLKKKFFFCKYQEVPHAFLIVSQFSAKLSPSDLCYNIRELIKKRKACMSFLMVEIKSLWRDNTWSNIITFYMSIYCQLPRIYKSTSTGWKWLQ